MKILLREARDSDMELIMAWRSNPLIYQGLYRQSVTKIPLTWQEHWDWWNSRYNWRIFIIQVNDSNWTRDVGYINIGQLDHWEPELGITIGEVSLWGKGVGKQALSLALDWLKEKGYKYVHTSIIKGNDNSIKLFEGLGFRRIGEAREGEWEYKLCLPTL